MRKSLLIICIVLIAATALNAQGLKFSAGAFGGISIPLVQDDQGQGTIFGVMGRINLMSLLVVEPHISLTNWGEPDPIDELDLGISGSKLTNFGVDVMLGGMPGAPGIKPYFLGGIGYYKIKNDDTQFDESQLGYAVGLGISIGLVPTIDLDVKAKGIIIPIEGASKKAVNITAGLMYNFGIGK